VGQRGTLRADWQSVRRITFCPQNSRDSHYAALDRRKAGVY
jgi:hypothetical protein